MNFKTSSVAACKVVALAPDTPKKARDLLDKECAIHKSLKHVQVLEFIDSLIVEPAPRAKSADRERETGKKRKRDDVQKEEREKRGKQEEDEKAGEMRTRHFPGYYMLLEIAGGGDLFDKIGASWTKKW